MKVIFASPKQQAPKGSTIINCTSISTDWGKNLSPMISGPEKLQLYGHEIWNVENGWQYSRVYKDQTNFPEWNAWRFAGYADKVGHRYPMGKGAVPDFSYITKKLGKLDWIESRKKIYLPLYFQKLERFCWPEIEKCIEIIESNPVTYIWDFDVRNDYSTFEEALNSTTGSLGHGFLLVDYIGRQMGKNLFLT